MWTIERANTSPSPQRENQKQFKRTRVVWGHRLREIGSWLRGTEVNAERDSVPPKLSFTYLYLLFPNRGCSSPQRKLPYPFFPIIICYLLAIFPFCWDGLFSASSQVAALLPLQLEASPHRTWEEKSRDEESHRGVQQGYAARDWDLNKITA